MHEQLLNQIINHFEGMLAGPLERHHTPHYKKGCWQYAPLNMETFCVELTKALRVYDGVKPSFIDVGCGLGTKVLAAHLMGCRANGVEINAAYAKQANKLLNNGRVARESGIYRVFRGSIPIIRDDARYYDYSPYDIIYFFCPMVNEQQIILEERIVRTAKSGALIMPHNPQSYNLWGRNRADVLSDLLVQLDINLYRKV